MYTNIRAGIHEIKVKQFFESLQRSNKLNDSDTKNDIRGELSSSQLHPSILICFTNRSGSTLVSSLLSTYGLCGKPNRFKNYEYFNHNFVISFSKKNNIVDMNSYIRSLVAKFSGSQGYFTSKVSASQLFWLAKDKILGKILHDPIFIYVKRKNIVSQAISLSIAQQTGCWTSLHKSKPNKDIMFKPELIIKNMNHISTCNSHFEMFFSLHSIEPIIVYYDELINNISGFREKLEKTIKTQITIENNQPLKLKRQATELNIKWEEKIRKMYSFYL